MIVGAHIAIPSKDNKADMAFFRDVLKLPSIDNGDGYMIFAIPPAEVSVFGGDSTGHKLHLMCDDMEAFLEEMAELGIAASEPQELAWGVLTHVTMPGGGALAVYEPKHRRPKHATAPRKAAKKKAPAKKAAAKKAPAKQAPARKKAKKRAKR